MKHVPFVLLGLSLAVAGGSFAAAQEMQGPPKVLTVTRELVKPGKNGDMHDKSESKFVTAMANAKWPTHYFALQSLSGPTRVDYLTGYPSFKAWQDDFLAQMKDKGLSAELDKDAVADGELLASMDQSVWTYDEDLSYRPSSSLADARIIEVLTVHIKPGHYKELQDLVKLVIDGHKKAGDSAHWATFDLAYGGDDEFAVFSDDKSMADIDTGFAEDKKFRDALGAEGMKKLEDLEADCMQDSDSELFAINPAQSYPPDEWVKAAPDFWKSKPAMAPKPAAKPSAKPAQ